MCCVVLLVAVVDAVVAAGVEVSVMVVVDAVVAAVAEGSLRGGDWMWRVVECR